jgi:flagellar hook-basal body complex protein FliE
MSIHAGIEPVAAIAATYEGNASAVISGSGAGDAFARLIQQGIGQMDRSVGAAETAMSRLAAGKSVEIHDVMIDLERARISVQTFVQVRNKLIESYQDLMRIQL